MRKFLALAAALTLFSLPAQAIKPPREESPAPRDMLESLGQGSSDEELARAIVAADAYPLGTLQNPVRVGGPDGAHAYLARLRCSNGSPPKVGPKAEGAAGAFGSITLVYPLDCGAAGPAKSELAIDLYHEGHVESRPPAGYSITP